MIDDLPFLDGLFCLRSFLLLSDSLVLFLCVYVYVCVFSHVVDGLNKNLNCLLVFILNLISRINVGCADKTL